MNLGETRVAPSVVQPRKRQDLVQRWAGEDLVLYDSRNGRLHILNATAAAVWALCDGRASATDIVAHLRTAFRLDADSAPERDVLAILRSFCGEKLLENLELASTWDAGAEASSGDGCSREAQA